MPIPMGTASVRTFTVPTEEPESDGTLAWESTTMILVEVASGGQSGLGYTYGHPALAPLIEKTLLPLLRDANPLAPQRSTARLTRAVRNVGQPGAVAMAISAVDVALWDLKAKLLGLPLADLLGKQRDVVPTYWSGGFTSSSVPQLRQEFAEARRRGFSRFKMKVGRDPAADTERVATARRAIGPDAELFVDANGAYSVRGALGQAERFRASRVTWFEEPVPAEDFRGLAEVRERLPPGMELATGEYGWNAGGATDVLQVDATRCGGITGFLAAAAVSAAWGVPLSSHTAPSIHVHACAAAPEPFRHLEYFRDHVRVEEMIFEGSPRAHKGAVTPDRTRPGLGLVLREKAAERFEVPP
jgi:L-alanine-DL-glutamate epimerase-like enolase superfamily enzyme